MLAADGEGGAECYSAATTKEQAKIVFSVAQAMAKKTPDLRQAYNVIVQRNDILCQDNDGEFRAVSSEDESLDGLNPHCVSLDELHAHKTRGVYDVFETALGSREQPLLLSITTAGNNIIGICKEIYDYGAKILANIIQDDQYFFLIYEADEGDDFTDPKTWVKANPNIDVSVKRDYLAGLVSKARVQVAAQANFKTKHLNIWNRTYTQWMDIEKWDKCGITKYDIESFRGERVWIALDLSSKLDITVLTMVFERDGELYVFTKYYLPENQVLEKSHSTTAHYATWAKEGLFTLTPGNVVDYEYILNDILQINEEFLIVDVAYDPWQAQMLAQMLMKERIECIEYRQIVKNMSEPMKHLEAIVHSQKFNHNGDPILKWMVSNVVATLDRKDNIYPNKEKPENKIDGVVSLIMAIGRVIVTGDDSGSIYDKQGITFV